MTRSHVLSRLVLASALAAALFAPPASAQRASLGERVSALETQAANNQGNIDLLNQLTALRNEVQALRGQIEELQQQNDQLQTSARNQYLDLDDRMNRLEGGSGAASSPGAAAPAAAPRPVAGPAARPAAGPVDSAPTVFGDAGLLANAADERSAYELAFSAMKEGRYAESANLFQAFLRAYPTGSYAPNALYWLGESYYVTSNYALAMEQFQAVLQRYPTHDKSAGALLKVGLSQYGLRDLPAAEATLGRVVAQYPGTDAARTADDRLRSIQLNSLR
ncbi:tol-pal system protein YbgF [Luteimonas sp. MC1825]|uniref:tol-pal system protein YbgF n=1 Tax=Luteimonas sp. MC1825 TaxID=2761107 RepID=UPI00160C9270|nr:tol-pal system protein YbgF [Luteimonas sp. MC1825]MBB6599953.1 tol-pal system protein YbgF [Luteimonas sp. MC1825]QOC87660.1 tol-pal system protein YbgF [Luteimonas sp. MC1825]